MLMLPNMSEYVLSPLGCIVSLMKLAVLPSIGNKSALLSETNSSGEASTVELFIVAFTRVWNWSAICCGEARAAVAPPGVGNVYCGGRLDGAPPTGYILSLVSVPRIEKRRLQYLRDTCAKLTYINGG